MEIGVCMWFWSDVAGGQSQTTVSCVPAGETRGTTIAAKRLVRTQLANVQLFPQNQEWAMELKAQHMAAIRTEFVVFRKAA